MVAESTRNRASGSGSAPPVETGGAMLHEAADGQLVVESLAGREGAFDHLVRRHQGRLFAYLRHRLPDVQDAEDVTQETFLRCWQRLHQYRSKYRFTTWLFTIGHRLAINHLRRRSRSHAGPADAGVLAQVVRDDAPAPDKVLLAAEEHRGVWAAATEVLTTEEIEGMWLRYAEELSSREIARVTGRTTVGVRVMLHRARLRLRERLESDCAAGHGPLNQYRASGPHRAASDGMLACSLAGSTNDAS